MIRKLYTTFTCFEALLVKRPCIITIFSHFPWCFYFCFLRVIISEHHRIKAHNFCPTFCPRFCSAHCPAWQSLKKGLTSKLKENYSFLFYIFSMRCFRFEDKISTEGRIRERAWEMPSEEARSSSISQEASAWLPRPTQRQPSVSSHLTPRAKWRKKLEKNNAFMIKVCSLYRARNICSKPQLCSIEYIYPTGGGVIRENWNIIYWFIEIRWISFSEFCILSQLLFSSQ